MSFNYKEQCHNFIDAVFDLEDRWKTGERNSIEGLMVEIPGDDKLMLLKMPHTVFIYPKSNLSVSCPPGKKATAYIPSLLNMYLNFKFCEEATKGETNESIECSISAESGK